LTLLMALTPLVIMAIGIFMCARYRINKSKQKEIAEFLVKQREIGFEELAEERAELLQSL